MNANPGPGIATRCQFQFSDGRSCRMLRIPAHASFCAFYAKQELQVLESQRLGAEISSSLNGDFLTATDINHVLGKTLHRRCPGPHPSAQSHSPSLAWPGHALEPPPSQTRVPLRLQIRPLEQSPRQRRPRLHPSHPRRFQLFRQKSPGAPRTGLLGRRMTVDRRGLQTGTPICQKRAHGEFAAHVRLSRLLRHLDYFR
jgi:hypothetical protein